MNGKGTVVELRIGMGSSKERGGCTGQGATKFIQQQPGFSTAAVAAAAAAWLIKTERVMMRER